MTSTICVNRLELTTSGLFKMKRLALALALVSDTAAAKVNGFDHYVQNPVFIDYVMCKFSQYMTAEHDKERQHYHAQIESAARQITVKHDLTLEEQRGGMYMAIGYARGVLDAHAYTAGVSTMKFTRVLKTELCAGIE